MQQDLPPEFWQGVQELNDGQYYACHDTLEALWLEEASEPPKNLYQGILQIAVACYHLGNHNWRGAVILLGEGQRRLTAYAPDFAGLNISHLIDTSTRLLEALQQAGPEQVEAFSQWVDPVGPPAGIDGVRLERPQLPRLSDA